MAGCSLVVDCSVVVGVSNDKAQCRFEGFIVCFLKEIFALDCFHIFPPMLVDGDKVDLLKLCYVVKGKGGYDAVCNGKLWDLVGEECGLGVSAGSSLKLIYNKQLKSFEAWFKRVTDSKIPSEIKELDNGGKFHNYLMAARIEIKKLLSENEVSREDFKGGLDVECKLSDVNEVKSLNLESNVEKEVSNEKLGEGNDADATEVVEEVDGGKLSAEVAMPMDVSDVVISSKSGLLNEGENHGDGGDDCVLVLDSSSVDKEMFGSKRKRKSMFDLLNWVTAVAQDPSVPAIGYLPEKSKWKSYSNEEAWKQVLLYREAAFNKKAFESSSEQQNWKTQKMHPSIYDDQPVAAPNLNYNLRERLKRDKKVSSGKHTSSKKVSSGKHTSSHRSSSGSSVGTEGDSDRTWSSHPEDRANKPFLGFSSERSIVDTCPNRLIPRGPSYQARVPEWTGVTHESDSKWLGTQIWPSEKTNPKLLIERDPIGKGREDSCGCSEPGSVECVRFHIGEKRAKLKLELGVAFYEWNFDKMGEDVRRLWTEEEEKKFKDVIETNLASSDKYFWDHLFRTFPKKSRAELVSYYCNVFLLQRRAYQNRHTPNNIDSDDDEESELRKVFGHQTQNSCGSILLTPKKPQSK